MTGGRVPGFAAPLDESGHTELYAERLRDGRIVLGTRQRVRDGWEPSELHVLERSAYLGLASWLAESVEEAWAPSLDGRRAESLGTARDLYGDAADGADRLAAEMLREVPPALLRRALLLLANSIGPDARRRLVEQLNRTDSVSEDAWLRKQLAESQEALAYVVAAASLYDAIDRGLAGPGADLPERE